MSARTFIVLLVVASFAACEGPEAFHAKKALTGQAGTIGPAGTAGTTAVTGAAGTASTGAAGTNVLTGAAGTTAAAGTTGAAGTTAAAGTTGAAGTTAAGGTTGAAGRGAAGTTAAGGTTGAAGTAAAGTTGAAGTGAAGTMVPSGPLTRIDANGTAAGGWSADMNFVGGNGGQTNNGTVDVAGLTNPAPQTVYQTTRIGNFTYTVPGYTAGTMHTVRLHFCETYFPPNATVAGPGARLCNVSINGTQVLTNYDIFVKAGAKMKAVIEQFPVAANATGQYVVQFTPTKDNCALGGLEIQ